MPDALPPGIAAPVRAGHLPRERRLDLDRAKGYAILLVVAGHLVANTAPPGEDWYEPLRYVLYRFHMPFFLYLSGTVAVLSGVLQAPHSSAAAAHASRQRRPGPRRADGRRFIAAPRRWACPAPGRVAQRLPGWVGLAAGACGRGSSPPRRTAA